MSLRFTKVEGLGNDFVLLEAGAPHALSLSEAVVRRLCDRRRGVGADGVVAVGPLRDGRLEVRFWNADGSLAGNCGNGLRCVVLHAARRGELGCGRSIVLRTDGAETEAELLSLEGSRATVALQMPAARFEPAAVPVRSERPLRDEALDIGPWQPRLTALSLGNPHVVLLDPDIDAEQWSPLARALQDDRRFPEGVNVGFARRLDARRIALRVWERGVGWTEACGTGACAAAVALARAEPARVGEPLTVELPGGPLQVTVAADGSSRLVGPARHVFDGELHGPPWAAVADALEG